MAGGVLVVVEVLGITDQEQFAAYQSQARVQLRERGGVLLGRGGAIYEGPALGLSAMVQRWPSEQAFRDWQDSDEYRPLLEIRRRVADIRLILIPEV